MDPDFWWQTLIVTPATTFGAGWGCGFNAGAIAYFDGRAEQAIASSGANRLRPPVHYISALELAT